MHGRLKVKTTAEQAEAKRIEREKKLKIYNAATQKVLEKRKNKEFDVEALHISGEILSANPDVYTLWNFRKEIFEALKLQKSDDEINKLYEDELHFIEGCLRANPKSYGSWSQRCHVLTSMPKPDWKRELMLCNKFLEYDERNFHCWDYRRFVVENAKIPPAEEFEFSSSKISSNFSNYSSWHYRSKLLPLIEPDRSQAVGITEEALLREFEIVQNAFFTDPEDQSAWFYHRWLLGRGQTKLDVHSVLISRDKGLLIFGLTSPVKVGENCDIQVTVNGEVVAGKWDTPTCRPNYSSVWVLSGIDSVKVETVNIAVRISGRAEGLPPVQTVVSFSSSEDRMWKLTESTTGSVFSNEISATASVFLTKELESCQELHELEPDNKWALLTIVLLMKALDPMKFEEEISNNLIKLETLDEKRRNYYRDLRSKFMIENNIEKVGKADTSLDLSGKALTVMYHLDFLVAMRDINLCDNNIGTLKDFSLLQGVEKLNLRGNNLTSLTSLRYLPLLQDLDLQDNNISRIDDLKVLSTCPSLQTLNIKGNPVTTTDDLNNKISQILPNVKHIT